MASTADGAIAIAWRVTALGVDREQRWLNAAMGWSAALQCAWSTVGTDQCYGHGLMAAQFARSALELDELAEAARSRDDDVGIDKGDGAVLAHRARIARPERPHADPIGERRPETIVQPGENGL